MDKFALAKTINLGDDTYYLNLLPDDKYQYICERIRGV